MVPIPMEENQRQYLPLFSLSLPSSLSFFSFPGSCFSCICDSKRKFGLPPSLFSSLAAHPLPFSLVIQLLLVILSLYFSHATPASRFHSLGKGSKEGRVSDG